LKGKIQEPTLDDLNHCCLIPELQIDNNDNSMRYETVQAGGFEERVVSRAALWCQKAETIEVGTEYSGHIQRTGSVANDVTKIEAMNGFGGSQSAYVDAPE
jgi:hypothetical protein